MAAQGLSIAGTAVPLTSPTNMKPGRTARAIKNMLKPVVTAEEAWQLLDEKFSSRFKSVREAFVKIDSECDGVISDKEMRFALAALGLEMTNGEYRKLWRKFDTTGDGSISYAEFNNKVGDMIHPQGMMVMNRPETPKIKEWQRRAIARGLKKKVTTLDAAFIEVDKDGSGKISHPEFIQLLRTLGLAKVGHEESFQMMQRARKPGNPGPDMTFEEFKDCMMEYMNIPEELLKEADGEGPKPDSLVAAEKILQDKLFNKFGAVQKAFRQFDEDKSGELSYDEFRKALKGLNILLTDEQFYALVKKFDTSLDGVITYQEFNDYLGPLIHPDSIDKSRQMADIAKYGGMQDGLVYKKDAFNTADHRKRGFEREEDEFLGDDINEKIMYRGEDVSTVEEDPAAASSSAGPSPAPDAAQHASASAPGSRRASAAGAGAAAVAEMRRASLAGRRSSGVPGSVIGMPAAPSPVRPQTAAARAHRAGSVATADFDITSTEDKMRRVLGRSWVQVFSDVKRAASASGNSGMALPNDQFRDVMAEKGVPLTSKEVRALALRYGSAGGESIDSERLLRNTFRAGVTARPATAAARPTASPMKGVAMAGTAAATGLGRPPTGMGATARPASAFVRPSSAALPKGGPALPALHATGKMIF